MKPPSKNTLKLIYAYEVGGGESYYNKYLKFFTWPGAASGPTIGIGIDTAYYTKSELAEIFSYLPAKQRQLVENATGKKGKAGEEYTKTLQAAKIEMPWNLAEKIFMFTTWKKFANLAESIFPQLEDLCGDAYGAIVSLVFNRGSSLKGDSREEMRRIKDLIPKKDYAGIAEQIRNMKRLWQGKGLDGLVRRREAEAAAVESCLQQS